jgi:cell shape-determining protein MreD
LGFIFGILLDLVSFKTLGISSIFFITFLFFVLLYQSKFEIATNTFVLVTSFLGSLGYLILIGYHDSLIFQAILSSIIGLLLFKLIQNSKIKSES